MAERIEWTRHPDGVVELQLARADKMNALDPAMFDALIGAGEALRGDAAVRAVVISGQGKAFCAGLDMASFERMGQGAASAVLGTAAGGTDLSARTHGISNAVLDTRWPKLVKNRAELAAFVEDGEAPPLAQLIGMMRDPRLARDDELPSTGIPLERERALSAAFIDTPEYGTRGTTALRVGVAGNMLTVEATERSDDNGSHRVTRPGDFERAYTFDIAG